MNCAHGLPGTQSSQWGQKSDKRWSTEKGFLWEGLHSICLSKLTGLYSYDPWIFTGCINLKKKTPLAESLKNAFISSGILPNIFTLIEFFKHKKFPAAHCKEMFRNLWAPA